MSLRLSLRSQTSTTERNRFKEKLTMHGNIDALRRKPVPKSVTDPVFDIDNLFSALALSLEDIHASAEKTVRDHIAKLRDSNAGPIWMGSRAGAERWLSEGQRFVTDFTCPFCAQYIAGNELIGAYKTYFNDAYNELKHSISTLQNTVARTTDESVLESIAQQVEVASSEATGWAGRVDTPTITFDSETFGTALKSLRATCLGLIETKLGNVAEATGNANEKAMCLETWQVVLDTVRAANSEIHKAADSIEEYKRGLSGESISSLESELLRLEATKRRYSPSVVALFGELTTARTEQEVANGKRAEAREGLDALMSQLLTQYESALNKILRKFGAAFEIEGFGGNFRGSGPRSEYGIRLRGKSVPLEGGPPSFSTALSEGDKRTLAFAFFIASALDSPNLAHQVVVIDDPMCSLDINRRQSTKQYLKEIHSKSEQLILLAHDAYFLRDFRNDLQRKNPTVEISIFRLKAVHDNYTDFDDFDIDRECESTYSKNHRILREFEAGQSVDPESVMRAIRPMLEGYLHRRFPGHLQKGVLFGSCIVAIEQASSSSPIRHAKNLVGELREINDFVGQFHHDDNPDAQSDKPTDAELREHVSRAFYVVHRGEPRP